jgi:hypothetical protein
MRHYVLFTVMRVHRSGILHSLVAGIVIAMILSLGCTGASPASPPPSGSSQQVITTPQTNGTAVTLSLRVAQLTPGAVLPEIYTCKGTSESPPVRWSGIPDEAKSLVLILEDPDAPAGTYTHWLVYNIAPRSGEMAQAQPNAKVLENEAQQGESSAGFRGYYPPCPPPGSTHRYIFRLYALDIYPALPTADRAAIDQVLAGHTIAKTEFSTTFMR